MSLFFFFKKNFLTVKINVVGNGDQIDYVSFFVSTPQIFDLKKKKTFIVKRVQDHSHSVSQL